MVLNQDIQKRVHDEIDTVLGDRLPTFADKDDLPFLNACISEALRWIPILPLGVHHRSLADDVYKGYFIPGGSAVIANGW